MKTKIAYLDDEELLGELFVEFLSELDYDGRFFTDPDEFIDFCDREKPALVFIDYRMPAARGDVVAEQLDPELPKILMTGELSVQALEMFNEVLPKPTKLGVLVEVIEKYTEGR